MTMSHGELVMAAKEKYRRQLAEKAKEKYKKPSLQEDLGFENVQHKDISNTDRAILKNLTVSPEAQIAYIKKNKPNLKVKTLRDGEIIVKREGEEKWGRIEPTGMPKSFGELAKDITDVGADIGAALGTTAATAAGGIAGAPAGGLGALPAAAAAGGAASGGIEALRQSLGMMAGVPQEYDPAQIGVATAAGAVSPLLVGTAGGAKAVAAGMKAGLTPTAARKAQMGLFGRGATYGKEKVLPWVGEKLTGIPKETIQTGAKKMATIKVLEKEGLLPVVEETVEKISQKLGSAKSQIGKQLEEGIARANQKVDISSVKKRYSDIIGEYEALNAAQPQAELQRDIVKARKTFSNLFSTGRPSATGAEMAILPDQVSAKHAWYIQDKLSDIAKFNKPSPWVPKGKGQLGKKLVNASKGGYGDINKGLNMATENADNILGSSGALKAQYKRLSEIQETIMPYFKTDEKAYTTLGSLNKKSKRVLFEKLGKVDKEFGTNVLDDARLVDATTTFGKGLGFKATLAQKAPLAAGMGALGYYAGHKSGYGGPAGMLGLALGAGISSPAAVRGLIGAGQALGKYGVKAGAAKQAAGYLGVKPATAGAWDYVTSGGGQ